MQLLDRFLHVLDDVAVSTGMANSPLDANELCAGALQKAGRTRFLDEGFRNPLAVLLLAYESEADLNILGRYAARWDTQRCLAALLRFDAEEEVEPSIAEERIARPIFVTGVPRSGTSLLHALLAQDPRNRIPRCYEAMEPYAPRGRDRRRQQVDRQLRMFENLAPQMAAMHPLQGDSPQECTEITAQVFQSLRFEMTHRVPGYQRWLDAEGHLEAYRFHRRFLRHLQHGQGPRRWVLKSPDHIHALDAIGTVYPDRELVFVHRDPLRVAASAMKLTEVVRQPFTRHIDRREIGRQVLGRLTEAAETMIAADRADVSRRIFHVHYLRFAADPVGTVASLYDHFDLEFSADLKEAIAQHFEQATASANRYDIGEFGLDDGDLRAAFDAYMRHFDIGGESSQWRRSVRSRAAAAA
ncbi:MAG: sulfotransferase [Alphaproteobacteria bacterium]|nr:sulfotransferase [Alphaproteobacteria bacterium]MBV9694305.1 sulfotransferase [Alphaproteobacteria bacterium]